MVLSVSLMVAAPVLASFGSQSDAANDRSVNETIISKTSPDGTWPFAFKEEKAEQVLSYSI